MWNLKFKLIYYTLLITSSVFFWRLGLTFGLKLTKTIVPKYGVLNAHTKLQCDFQLENNEELYSLKWYKDGSEFFRYKPADHSITTFQYNGTTVNKNLSSINEVHLEPISLSSRGIYRCEISAEAPTFQTLHEEHSMNILIMPSKGPKIIGIHPWYNIGNNLTADCIVDNCFPKPKLIWFVNKMQIDEEKCNCIRNSKSKKVINESLLYSAKSHLNFVLDPQYFQDGSLNFECRSYFGDSHLVLDDSIKTSIKSDLGLHFSDSLSDSSLNKSYIFVYILILIFNLL